MSGIPEDIKPVEFMARTRFKLSFNSIGNCTSMKNFADQFDGEWVWLVNADNGGNSPLYTEEALQQAVLAERERCVRAVEAFSGFGDQVTIDECAANIRREI